MIRNNKYFLRKTMSKNKSELLSALEKLQLYYSFLNKCYGCKFLETYYFDKDMPYGLIKSPVIGKVDEPNIVSAAAKSYVKQVLNCEDNTKMLRSDYKFYKDNEDENGVNYRKREYRKTIMVGSNYQADVPKEMKIDSNHNDHKDKLLWQPDRLSYQQTEEYLKQYRATNPEATGVHLLPLGSHLKDDEQALYLLLQCDHNVQKALNMKTNLPPENAPRLWTEEECRNFENGIRTYGKDFYLIQQKKVTTRSVGELVQFYYLWKKTERHDVFANRERLEKKKYTLHPGLTDFMDVFLEDEDESKIYEEAPASI